VTPSGSTLLARLLCSPDADVEERNFFHSSAVNFFTRDSFIGVYLSGVLRLPAESCFTLENFDTLSLLRVLPFSLRNQRNANSSKFRRVSVLFFLLFTKTFEFLRLFLLNQHNPLAFWQKGYSLFWTSTALSFQ
jgi:hypothetical protein